MPKSGPPVKKPSTSPFLRFPPPTFPKFYSSTPQFATTPHAFPDRGPSIPDITFFAAITRHLPSVAFHRPGKSPSWFVPPIRFSGLCKTSRCQTQFGGFLSTLFLQWAPHPIYPFFLSPSSGVGCILGSFPPLLVLVPVAFGIATWLFYRCV